MIQGDEGGGDGSLGHLHIPGTVLPSLRDTLETILVHYGRIPYNRVPFLQKSYDPISVPLLP